MKEICREFHFTLYYYVFRLTEFIVGGLDCNSKSEFINIMDDLRFYGNKPSSVIVSFYQKMQQASEISPNDFRFAIVKFPWLRGDVPRLQSYG